MLLPSERREIAGDYPRRVDGGRVNLFEPQPQPSRRCSPAPLRFVQRDPRREFERHPERDTSEFPRSEFSGDEVASL